MINKKIVLITLLLILIIPVTTVIAKEKTISEWEAELSRTQTELESNNAQKQKTEAEINNIKSKINDIYSQVAKINEEIDAKTKESEMLEEEIKKKNEQIKELMRYYEVSSSGIAILEYIMGAEDITDLIYRLSVTEQISKYNKKTIEEMNEMIRQNEEIKKELSKRKDELAALEKDLNNQIAELNKTKNYLNNEGISLSESIKEMQNTISYLKKLGCKNNETQTTCLNRIYASSSSSGGYLPSGTTFYRPLVSGRISSNYGWRTLYGSADNHPAIDIATPTGSNVYAVATGRVAKTVPQPYSSCGNQIILHHEINGRYYTSHYCHLDQILVSVGQIVTKDTVIAKSGNTGNSTGPHLHLSLATGRWYTDYYSYYGSDGFMGHVFDPREVIVFPPLGSSFYNR